MAPPSLTVVGSVNLDLVARVASLPRPGETLTSTSFALVPGGKGANQALAAVRMGAAVRMVGCVGSDRYADLALTSLRAGGVDLSRVRVHDGPTGIAMILVDDDGENVIVVMPGANGELAAVDVTIPHGDAVLVQLEIPDGALVAAAERATGLFALNAAPARAVPAAVRDRADVVIVNGLEASALGPVRRDALIAVTFGADGAELRRGDGTVLARATPPPVVAVDGTGAGDSFCGALVVGLLEGRDHDVALRRACAAGALAASRAGAQPSLPTAPEVDEIMAR